jgi:hypothetical protein
MRVLSTILCLALLAATSPSWAKGNVFQPSARALAAAGPDEPPPHADPALLNKPPPKQVVVVEDDAPVYKKWWFWVAAAVVVGGTVALGVATFKSQDSPPKACPATTRACFGDGRGGGQ